MKNLFGHISFVAGMIISMVPACCAGSFLCGWFMPCMFT